MKTLSLSQPYASLIVHDLKRVETRSWYTDVRGRIAIHANLREPSITFGWCFTSLYVGGDKRMPHFVRFIYDICPFDGEVRRTITMFERLPRGCIVGSVELYDCKPVEELRPHLSEQELAFGDYGDGRFGWLLRDAVLLDAPVPAKGHRRFWNWEGGK